MTANTWVLLRGLAREQRHWGGFASMLRERLPAGDRVVALDLPGNGSRWREASPTTVGGIVDALREDLAARGFAPPYGLVALSLGGMAALEWSQRAPRELRGCVLINSSAGAFSPFWQRLRPASYPRLLRAVLPGTTVQKERAVLLATSNRALDAATLDDWVAIARSRPVAAGNAMRELVAAARFRAPAQVGVPLLLLASRGDRLVSHRCSQAMARAWTAPLREHPDAGHDLPLDDPQWVAERIAEWARTL